MRRTLRSSHQFRPVLAAMPRRIRICCVLAARVERRLVFHRECWLSVNRDAQEAVKIGAREIVLLAQRARHLHPGVLLERKLDPVLGAEGLLCHHRHRWVAAVVDAARVRNCTLRPDSHVMNSPKP